MRSYATAMREMEARGVNVQPVIRDLYKSDRDQIEEMRRRFARDLELARLRGAIR